VLAQAAGPPLTALLRLFYGSIKALIRRVLAQAAGAPLSRVRHTPARSPAAMRAHARPAHLCRMRVRCCKVCGEYSRGRGL